jgi:DNA invertase Pin-like site-specific DNA recombinase
MTQKALIYCRVSDTKQKIEGSGLDSQEHRCRQFAMQHDLSVERVFHDDVTGKGDHQKRPAMIELLEHVKKNRADKFVLILDDIKRFSRDVYFYWDLIRKLDEFDVQPMSPNFIFANTPEGRFQQSITVAAGEYERESNARQTRQKTKARLEAGFHAFNAPVGFKFVKAKEGGKRLVKDEPAASVLTDMMEGFASGRFQTKQEARRFLENHPDFPKGKSGRIGNNQVDKILSDPLYAGYIQYLPWGVTLRQGQHEGMVDYTTFQRIQDRLKTRAYAPARRDLNEDFPLRNAVACECGNSMTAAWSRSGTGKRYPYYVCQNRKCQYKGKTIRKADIEGEFEKLLKTMTPSKPMIKTATRMFKALWDNQAKAQNKQKLQLEAQLQHHDDDINNALNRIVESRSATVVAAFEKRIEDLEHEKRLLKEKIKHCGVKHAPFNTMYRTAMEFLANPYQLWANGGYKGKRAVLKLVLKERLVWDRKGMYRTPQVSVPFKFLGDLPENFKMVPNRGIEYPEAPRIANRAW